MLDPRAQLALTMIDGLANQNEPEKQNRKATTTQWDRVRKEQHYTEALTKALLDPCTTVQEAVLDALVQRSMADTTVTNNRD